MDERYAKIPIEWMEVVRAWEAIPLVCRHGHHFYESLNVGSWACAQHAQELDVDRMIWPCCGHKAPHLGCVRADHNRYDVDFARGSADVTVKRIPLDVINYFGMAGRPGVSANDSGGMFYARRIDEDADWKRSAYTVTQ